MADVADGGKYAAQHHRIRLSDADLEMILAALRQNRAGNISAARKAALGELIDRLIERRPGRH